MYVCAHIFPFFSKWTHPDFTCFCYACHLSFHHFLYENNPTFFYCMILVRFWLIISNCYKKYSPIIDLLNYNTHTLTHHIRFSIGISRRRNVLPTELRLRTYIVTHIKWLDLHLNGKCLTLTFHICYFYHCIAIVRVVAKCCELKRILYIVSISSSVSSSPQDGMKLRLLHVGSLEFHLGKIYAGNFSVGNSHNSKSLWLFIPLLKISWGILSFLWKLMLFFCQFP